MKLTAKEYNEFNKRISPPSPSFKNISMAFLTGGTVCVLGQVLFRLYQRLGLSNSDAYTWVSITLVFLAALLTGLNVFDKIAKVAGAGTLVPITGFANAMVSPAMEFKSEGLVLGLGAKMFTVAGPVLVYGISAGIVYGLVLVAANAL
ncbi:MAG: stage V sporulation protein AC [Oscillospiraceae bacterium]|nr:stage V sporulation protein AC [Oscillospiraceae bacterium]